MTHGANGRGTNEANDKNPSLSYRRKIVDAKYDDKKKGKKTLDFSIKPHRREVSTNESSSHSLGDINTSPLHQLYFRSIQNFQYPYFSSNWDEIWYGGLHWAKNNIERMSLIVISCTVK